MLNPLYSAVCAVHSELKIFQVVFSIQFKLKIQIPRHVFFTINCCCNVGKMLNSCANKIIFPLLTFKRSLKRPISEGWNFLGQNFRSEFSRPVTALEKVVFTVWDAVRSAICRGEECCLRRMRWKIFRCIFHISPISCDLDYSLQLQFCAFSFSLCRKLWLNNHSQLLA